MNLHIHHDCIVAWAKGASIQVLASGGRWLDIPDPLWNAAEYRVKPEPKPDVIRYMSAWSCNPGVYTSKESSIKQEVGGQIKLTFDGETDKLKSVEMVNGS